MGMGEGQSPGVTLAEGPHCKRHSPEVNLGPGEQDQAPWQEPGEATGASAPGLGLSWGALLGPWHPLSPGECPCHPLIPRRTPVDLGEWSSASPELGPRGQGARHSPNLRETCGLLQFRPPHCEDPPVFPSIRGSPLRDGETEEHPGDGLFRDLASSFQGRPRARHVQGP